MAVEGNKASTPLDKMWPRLLP